MRRNAFCLLSVARPRGFEQQLVAAHRLRALQRPGWKLNRREGPEPNGHSPGSNRVVPLHDDATAIDKRDVDGELHEERVNGVARSNDQRRPVFEAAPAKQAFAPLCRCKRGFQARRNDLTSARVSEDRLLRTRRQ